MWVYETVVCVHHEYVVSLCTLVQPEAQTSFGGSNHVGIGMIRGRIAITA